MVESSLGILGACLPTLRPMFKGFSPESVIRSIRSALSLHSLGSRRSKADSQQSRRDKDIDDESSSHIAFTGVEGTNEAKAR